MSRQIFRQVVPVDDCWHTLELSGPIVHVATRLEDAVEFWFIDDPAQPVTAHAFRVVGTGEPFGPAVANYIGAAITPSGKYVWHLVERERGAAADG